MKRYIREPFAALSHLLGAGLSVAALVFLVEQSGDSQRAFIACFVYGMSLIALYIASALTHGLNCSQDTLSKIERCDHAAIFLLIAGTYTPVCLLIVRGALGWCLLASEWCLALVGLYSIFINTRVSRSMRVATYLTMGWLFLLALGPIVSAVPNSMLAWLITGGLLYSIGAIFFLTNKPNFWKGYFEAHDLWHVFVLGGSACHFIFIKESLLAFVV